jgi:hypothetical protein
MKSSGLLPLHTSWVLPKSEAGIHIYLRLLVLKGWNRHLQRGAEKQRAAIFSMGKRFFE